MENSIKQLTTEELDSIKNLQKQYNSSIFDLGSLEAQLQFLQIQIQTLTTDKINILSDMNKIGEKEKELIKSLEEKYGAGNIDLVTGNISPF